MGLSPRGYSVSLLNLSYVKQYVARSRTISGEGDLSASSLERTGYSRKYYLVLLGTTYTNVTR